MGKKLLKFKSQKGIYLMVQCPLLFYDFSEKQRKSVVLTQNTKGNMMFLIVHCWNALSRSCIQNVTSSAVGVYSNNFTQGECLELLPIPFATSCHCFSRGHFPTS